MELTNEQLANIAKKTLLAMGHWVQVAKVLSELPEDKQVDVNLFVAVALSTFISSEQHEKAARRANDPTFDDPIQSYDDLVKEIATLGKGVALILHTPLEEEDVGKKNTEVHPVRALTSLGLLNPGDVSSMLGIQKEVEIKGTEASKVHMSTFEFSSMDDIPALIEHMKSIGIPHYKMDDVIYGAIKKFKEGSAK